MTGSTITLRSVLLNTAAAVAITAGLATTAPARANVGADAGAGAQDVTAAQDAAGAGAGTSAGKAPGAAESAQRFDIPAQAAADALNEWARQANRQIVFPYAETEGRRTRALSGTMTPRTALQRLADPLGLKISTENATTITLIGRAAPGESLAAGGGGRKRWSSRGEEAVPQGQEGIAEILVVGSRSQNVDIRRSEDDAQPYVVFDARQIRDSAARSVDEFLMSRLPMNAQSLSLSQTPAATSGQFNLRGLGNDETIVLVDGRRIPNVATSLDFAQPNISGIPMASIERIEVLPSTSGGIYGGGATGGVVNIILKRDYSGLEVEMSYGGSFRGDAERTEISFNGGFSFEGGRTRISISGARSDQDALRAYDRNFARDAFSLLAANAPSSFLVSQQAFGPTPNIISTSGANLILDPAYGATALGSPWTHVPDGYAGISSDNAAALVANAGSLRVDGGSTVISSGPLRYALIVDVRREMTSWLDAWLSFSAEKSETDNSTPARGRVTLPENHPSNPFQQSISAMLTLPGLTNRSSVDYVTLRGTAGLIFRLFGDWSGALEYGRSENSTSSKNQTVTDISSGEEQRAAALRDLDRYPPNYDLVNYILETTPADKRKSVLKTWTLRLGGSVVNLPAGAVALSGLLEKRSEKLSPYVRSSAFILNPGGDEFNFYRFSPAMSRDTNSAYAEVRIPVLSKDFGLPFAYQLDAVASVRQDNYESAWAPSSSVPNPDDPFPMANYSTNKFESTDYTLGLLYSPIRSLMFRASYGTGFRPPSLFEGASQPPRVGSVDAIFFGFPPTDPRRNNEPLTGDPNSSPVGGFSLIEFGNSDVRPETSKSLSLGLVFKPAFAPGLRLSLDVTEIKKSDEISGLLASPQNVLDNEAQYPDRVVRAPLTPEDISNGFTAGRVIGLDTSVVNLARTKLRAFDFKADYEVETARFGNWQLYALASHMAKYQIQGAPGGETIGLVGKRDGPLKWRGNAGINWDLGRWTAGWNAQYYGTDIPS